jgi:hypothetical protein
LPVARPSAGSENKLEYLFGCGAPIVAERGEGGVEWGGVGGWGGGLEYFGSVEEALVLH